MFGGWERENLQRIKIAKDAKFDQILKMRGGQVLIGSSRFVVISASVQITAPKNGHALPF
jgi:hypothetical protein